MENRNWRWTKLLGKSRFSEYLAEGLKQLSQNGIDVNTLLNSYSQSQLAVTDSGAAIELAIGPWYCDACGELIERPESGMLQWLVRSINHHRVGRDLRIVHHLQASPRGGAKRCCPDVRREMAVDQSTLADYHLNTILGHDGLVILLSLIGGVACKRGQQGGHAAIRSRLRTPARDVTSKRPLRLGSWSQDCRMAISIKTNYAELLQHSST